MGQYSVGQPVRRREDVRFLTGLGRYAEDIAPAGALFATFLRSPVAHAEISRLDTAAASALEGVQAIFTSDDLNAAGVRPVPIRAALTSRDGSDVKQPVYPALADKRVRYVGQCVAVVIATTRHQALAARDLIDVDYQSLDVVSTARAAARPDAVQLHDTIAGNLCFDWATGNEEAVNTALQQAAHVIELELDNTRMTASPMENRGCVCSVDPSSGLCTLEGSVQNVFAFRALLASAFDEAPETFRVSAPDVGGGFGAKNQMQAEHVALMFAARQLGVPVKWTNERSETFLSDAPGRAVSHRVRLGLDNDHRFCALHVDGIADMGAYLSTNGPSIPTGATASVMGGPYSISTIFMNVRGYFTNTVPTDAYRGAGRPEANYITERLIEAAARQLNVDAVELRRKNLINDSALPYTNALGKVIDSGAFNLLLERCLEVANVSTIAERATQALANNKLRGVGIACYLESTLGMPSDNSRVEFNDNGDVTLTVGTQSNGQGHETVFSQLLADRLGIDMARVRYKQADTSLNIPGGGGHGGSRSLQIGGSAISIAADIIIKKGKRVASHLLETAVADIEFDNDRGTFVVTGTDKSVTIDAVAQAAASGTGLEPEEEPGLHALGEYEREAHTYPNGCHVVEVEIDKDTGAVAVVDYHIVDDFGRVINPLVVGGQVYGGVAQGMGQALLEITHYDDQGQLVTGSFMDYTMPRADDLPHITIDMYEGAAPDTNPLGIKGCGEAGCVGATPAIINAVHQILHDAGVANVDALNMPLTHEKVWRALNTANV